MLKIEYEIKLNESGRPYIDLPDEYIDKPEDKFFVLEFSKYFLQSAYVRRSNEFDKETADKLNDCIIILEQISDEVAIILYNDMQSMGEIAITTHRNYHIQVDTVSERNELKYRDIIYNNKIFNRQEGLKVLVLSDMKIYELREGIDNENWFEIVGK